MSYYRQQNRSRLTVGSDGNALVMLIAINLVAFILLAFIKVVYYFVYSKDTSLALYQSQVLDWVTLPANFSTFITRPWTLVTHFIAHDSVWHILANMLWLWGFGYIMQDLTGNRKIIPVFIYGALAGAVAFMLAYNVLPPLRDEMPGAKAIGASAGVMAVAIATTVLAPGYRIFPLINGGIPLWVLTMIFVIIDLATIPYSNPGGHIAHLAGAGMGFLFVAAMRRGQDWSLWMNNFWDWVNNLFNPDKPKKGRTVKTQLFYKSAVQPFKKTANVTQQRIDDILDKIHQKGYQSLSEEEKEILKRASQEDLS